MRIGIVTERIGMSLGGAERWTYDFARWLLQEGHDVDVVHRRDVRCAVPEGVSEHPIGSGRSPLVFAAAAASRAASLQVDVVHDMGCGWNCDVLQPHCGSRTAAIHRNLQLSPSVVRPMTRSLQHMLPRYRRFAALCARQYAAARRVVVAVSHRVARDVQRHHGVAPEQIRVIYNGVDTERFSPTKCAALRKLSRECLGIADRDVVLLLVATNLRLKGLPALIRSTAALHRSGAPVKLVVVGGKRTNRYERVCRRLGVDARFVGSVVDPLPFYAAADIYVHPTFYDPCSLVVLEAWACGLPVVTTRFNGCSELMRDGLDELILHDPSDVQNLQSCLRKLLDRDVRARVGVQTRELAEENSANRNFRKLLSVYGEVPRTQRRAA